MAGKHRFKHGEGCEIATSAVVSATASLGSRVRIGEGAIIGDQVSVGDDCFIGARAIIGEATRDYYRDPDSYSPERTTIGARSVVRSNSCIYAGVEIGDDFQCGSFVSIREHTVIGDGCSVGTYCDIQGECRIGEGCRLHSGVHIAQFSILGDYVWMLPYVTLLNAPVAPAPPDMELKGPTVGSYSVILARSLLMPGVTLGKHVVVSANSKVSRSFEDWDMVKGDPAEKVCDSRQFFYTDGDRVFRPYPWMLHRRAGFPWEKDIPPEWEVGTRAPGTEGGPRRRGPARGRSRSR